MEISLTPTILNIGGLPIANTVITAAFMTVVFACFGVYATRRFSLVPGRIQTLLEIILNFVSEQLEGAFVSKEQARKFTPFLLSMLLFLIIANQLTVVPVIGQVVYEGKPLFKTVTSHLTGTLALALVTLGTAHLIALYINPLKHLSNFFKFDLFFKARSLSDFGNAFLENFLGFLDIIGEIAKLMSLSFRLFGNIFAGELMIAIIAGISFYTQIFVPIPFMILSIFSGFVQAAVFTLLTVAFVSGTVQGAGVIKQDVLDQKEIFNPPESGLNKA